MAGRLAAGTGVAAFPIEAVCRGSTCTLWRLPEWSVRARGCTKRGSSIGLPLGDKSRNFPRLTQAVWFDILVLLHCTCP